MRKRPKRDLRKRWRHDEEAAETADAAARSSAANADEERLLILDHQRLWEILTRYGIPQLGRSKLKRLGVEAIQLRRLNPGKDLPAWIKSRVRMTSAGKPAETVTVGLLTRLVQGINDDAKRAAATRELGGWVVEVREQTLLRHAKAWVRRHSGGRTPADPRVPRFDHARDGALVFEPLESESVWKQREVDFLALMHRIDDVIPSRSHITVGDSGSRLLLMEWRTLSPLLQWEESGFTERHWSELSDDELRRFVIAGDERENILTNRDDDLTRVRAALHERKPPVRLPDGPVSRRTPEDEAWDDFELQAAADLRRLVNDEETPKRRRRGHRSK